MTNDPLDRFRRAAKNLKTGYDAGSIDARARVAQAKPRRDGAALKHADFLHVIAREANFATWQTLKGAVETLGLPRAQALQRLKMALHNGQPNVANRLLAATPDLAKDHFGLLCALYDVTSVQAMLANDTTFATAKAGPHVPLIHLCRSRMFTVWPDRAADAVAIAELLLANGADVNEGSDENGGPLSPLYWALGHAGNLTLAEWLLQKGADPNDGESLYHATELGHADGVRLLIEHGADPKRTNALPRAMDFDDIAMVRLLLDAGADPNEGSDARTAKHRPHSGIPVLHQAARRMTSGPVLDVLLSQGADPCAVWHGHSAYALAKVFGNDELATRIEDRELAGPLTETEAMLAIAAKGRIPEGFVDPAKLPDMYRGLLREVLHLDGKLPHLRALVAIGLEWDRPDDDGVTPVQAAGWVGRADVMGYFLSLMPDLSHVNKYGGTLLSTILHGAENNPTRGDGDYVACLRMALEQGVALPRKALDASGDTEISNFLQQWANDRPGQVVEYGIA